MNKMLVPVALVSTLLFSACSGGSSAEDQKKELETEVLTVHDEAMNKMDEISKLRRSLRTLKEKKTDTAEQAILERDIEGLALADEVMMNWMREYTAPDSLENQAALHYLNQELVKIERVKTIMDSTLVAARKTLAKHDTK